MDDKPVEHDDNEWGIELGGSEEEEAPAELEEATSGGAVPAPEAPPAEPRAEAPKADDSNLDDLLSELESL